MKDNDRFKNLITAGSLAALLLGLTACGGSEPEQEQSAASQAAAEMPAGGAPAEGMEGPGGPGAGGPPGMPDSSKTEYTKVISIVDGQYQPEESLTDFVTGEFSATEAKGISIESDQEQLNGLFVRGEGSTYTLTDSTMRLSGNGLDDFVGIGSGAMADHGADLTLRNVDIETWGTIRSAVTSTEKSVVRIYDSVLYSHGGEIPDTYKPRIGAGMMEPPAALELGGTARTALAMFGANMYLYNTKIIADGWAALSTDACVGGVYVEANDSEMIVKGPGYGVYSDNGCNVVINDSLIQTETYNAIMAGEAVMALNNVTGKSDRSIVMVHNVMGKPSEIAALDIKGGNFESADSSILVRSANLHVNIDNASFKAGNGVVLQSVINPDPNRTKVNGQPTADIVANIKNSTIDGNIVHDDPERKMILSLENSTLNGAVEKATLNFGTGAKWKATANSTATLEGVTDASVIDAPAGVTITASAGQGTSLSGSHKLASGGTLVIEG